MDMQEALVRIVEEARVASRSYGVPLEVRVVVDGGGVYVFQGENDLTSKLRTVAGAGVVIQACHNALHEKQIDPSTIPDFVQVVPGGVPALVEAQNEGYRYVKP